MLIKKISYLALGIILSLVLNSCSQKSHLKSSEAAFIDLKTYVEKINEPEQRKKLRELVISLEGNVTQYQNEISRFSTSAEELFYNYDTQRQTLDRLHKEWIQTNQNIQNNLIDIHFDLKENASDVQWLEIVKLEKNGFDNIRGIE